MISCKLCNTILTKKNLRRDGSMLCPECGQIYWKAAVDKALQESAETANRDVAAEIRREYAEESRISTARIRARVA